MSELDTHFAKYLDKLLQISISHLVFETKKNCRFSPQYLPYASLLSGFVTKCSAFSCKSFDGRKNFDLNLILWWRSMSHHISMRGQTSTYHSRRQISFFILTLTLRIFSCPEKIVCLLCLLYKLKCTPDDFYHGSKHYKPWSILVAILAIKLKVDDKAAQYKADVICCEYYEEQTEKWWTIFFIHHCCDVGISLKFLRLDPD